MISSEGHPEGCPEGFKFSILVTWYNLIIKSKISYSKGTPMSICDWQ